MDIKRRLRKIEKNMEIEEQKETNEIFLNTATDFWKYAWEISHNSSKFKNKEIICSPLAQRIMEEFIEKCKKWDEMLKRKAIKIEETKDK